MEVRDLRVAFPTDDGLVRAVDGLSFTLERGKTLGIVGESGSGKSVSSMAILGLHDARTARIEGSIRVGGTEVIGLSEALRSELAADGIGVSAFCPGPVQTNIREGGRTRPER